MTKTKTKTKTEGGLTPMMRQFRQLKSVHPDALLLFRCGDFYETYAEDAVAAARMLGITLTKRSNGATAEAQATAMAGFPFHALETYLPRLIRQGQRVAICDQLEDPKKAKTLVRRGITELVTPGVTLSDNVLDARQNNFLAAAAIGAERCGVALADISTGEFLVLEGPADQALRRLAALEPKEVLTDSSHRGRVVEALGAETFAYTLDDWSWTADTAADALCRHYGVSSLKGFGISAMPLAVTAAGAVLRYLVQTQHTQLAHLSRPARLDERHTVRLDPFTIRSLELVSAMGEGGVSLLDVIDHTATPMGARLLHRWLLLPLTDTEEIRRRQDVVEEFFRQPGLSESVGAQLSHTGDMERLASKVAVSTPFKPRATPRDMAALRSALAVLPSLKSACAGSGNEALGRLADRIDPVRALGERLERDLTAEPPLAVGRGRVIAEGVSAELDELRRIAYSGKDYLLTIQRRESEQTGIGSLKIGFNNVFGYYIEVRNTFRDRVPADWIRKQTLVSAERYITPELKAYEEKILGAEEKILELETRLYNELLAEAQTHIAALQRTAHALATLDCLHSHALAAAEGRYVRPVVDESTELDITAGRHPVIERQMGVGEQYVPNDTHLDTERQQIIILTGPNMAGKSALLRQTALITILAQIGSFVPADSAHIGVADKIFTRVGASDNISQGESTFMVEMTEAANILNNLTPRSLVLFDELGRGTSTYDGISIAWAIVEHLHNAPRARCRTLFATHYHELNDMAATLPRVANYHIAVREKGGHVIFLRHMERGGSEHSFGIHVATIAGMESAVVRRAAEVLAQLEGKNTAENRTRLTTARSAGGEGIQMSFYNLDDPVLCQIRDAILHLDLDSLTPLEALNKLAEIRRLLTGKD